MSQTIPLPDGIATMIAFQVGEERCGPQGVYIAQFRLSNHVMVRLIVLKTYSIAFFSLITVPE
jgi:hypothetical protein